MSDQGQGDSRLEAENAIQCANANSFIIFPFHFPCSVSDEYMVLAKNKKPFPVEERAVYLFFKEIDVF